MSTTEGVWVGIISHPLGVDVRVGETEEQVLEAIDEYVKENWDEEINHEVEKDSALYENVDWYTSEARVDRYFTDTTREEYYELEFHKF